LPEKTSRHSNMLEEIMINKISITLVLLLFIASCASTGQRTSNTSEKDFENNFCSGGTWGVFLPDEQGNPEPNIKLINLQHSNADDKCGNDMTIEQIMAINKDVMPAAARAFGTSKAQFEVMVRFTLTPAQPSTIEMKYHEDDPIEPMLLDSFKRQLQTLRNYRSKKGTTYVVFHYAINKAIDDAGPSEQPKQLAKLTGKPVLQQVNQPDWQ
jgi:hypothetical protein